MVAGSGTGAGTLASAVKERLDAMLVRLTAADVHRWELDVEGHWHKQPLLAGVDVQTEMLQRAREQTPVA